MISVGPQGRQGQATPAFFCPILLGKHLRHAGPVCSLEVKGDIDAVGGQVMGQAPIESRAIDMDRFPTCGRVRDRGVLEVEGSFLGREMRIVLGHERLIVLVICFACIRDHCNGISGEKGRRS